MTISKLKKYSSLSIIMGGVMLLSGCDVVGTCDYHASVNHIYLSDAPEKDASISSVVITTSTGTTTTVATTTSVNVDEDLVECVDEPYVNAGASYDNFKEDLNKYTDILFSSYAKDMDSRYIYYKYQDFYSITNDDSITDICDRFNITVDDFYSYNPKIANYNPGTFITYPVMDEIYVGKKGENINSIAVDTGVDIELILNNNNLNLSDDILNENTYIFLHKFIGNETSYKTNKGIVNVINNNRIFGNKVVQAGGFAGASRYVLVLNESVYSYGVNDVICYTFDGNSYTSDIVCFNAKDILSVDGMPVALLRNDDDIKALAESVSVDVDDMAFMQWGSVVSDGYSVSNSDDNSYVIMNGIKMDDLDLGKSLVKKK